MATRPTLPEQLAAARAETRRLQELQDKIDAVGIEARNSKMLAHYRHAASERASEYRQHRDDLKNKLDEIAMSDQLDIDALFAAWVALRDADAKAGALNTHSSMLDSLEGPRKNHIGACEMPRGAAVNELYTPKNGWTFSAFVDRALALRADRVCARHIEELRAQAHREVSAAEEAARRQAGDA